MPTEQEEQGIEAKLQEKIVDLETGANAVIAYLKKIEWGQEGRCAECKGMNESWIGHRLCPEKEDAGHERGCEMAAALGDLGETPLMRVYEKLA